MAVGEAAVSAMASKVLENAAESVLKRIGQKLSIEWSRVRVQFTKTFQKHLFESLHRAKYVKTVTSKDKPVDLAEIYVGLTLRNEECDTVDDISINPCLDHGKRIIVSGTGGAGKTVLMRHLLLESVENKHGFIPLFVELRNVDFTSNSNFQSALHQYLSENMEEVSKNLVVTGLEEGLFAIYLDGFDEINPEFTQKAGKMMAVFSRKFRKCSVILSTRPGTGIHSLVDFSVFHINPLEKGQAIELVKKNQI